MYKSKIPKELAFQNAHMRLPKETQAKLFAVLAPQHTAPKMALKRKNEKR